jgi:hypothetical protein
MKASDPDDAPDIKGIVDRPDEQAPVKLSQPGSEERRWVDAGWYLSRFAH